MSADQTAAATLGRVPSVVPNPPKRGPLRCCLRRQQASTPSKPTHRPRRWWVRQAASPPSIHARAKRYRGPCGAPFATGKAMEPKRPCRVSKVVAKTKATVATGHTCCYRTERQRQKCVPVKTSTCHTSRLGTSKTQHVPTCDGHVTIPLTTASMACNKYCDNRVQSHARHHYSAFIRRFIPLKAAAL